MMYFKPFLAVIESPLANGSITAITLCSVGRLLRLEVLPADGSVLAAAAVSKVALSLTRYNFELVHRDSAEVVYAKLLHCIVALLGCGAGLSMAHKDVLGLYEFSFSIFSDPEGRYSDLMRYNAETALTDMMQVFFGRFDQLVEAHSSAAAAKAMQAELAAAVTGGGAAGGAADDDTSPTTDADAGAAAANAANAANAKKKKSTSTLDNRTLGSDSVSDAPYGIPLLTEIIQRLCRCTLLAEASVAKTVTSTDSLPQHVKEHQKQRGEGIALFALEAITWALTLCGESGRSSTSFSSSASPQPASPQPTCGGSAGQPEQSGVRRCPPLLAAVQDNLSKALCELSYTRSRPILNATLRVITYLLVGFIDDLALQVCCVRFHLLACFVCLHFVFAVTRILTLLLLPL